MDDRTHDCNNRSTNALSDEVTLNLVGSLVRSSMELSINRSPPASYFSEMITNTHSNTVAEDSMYAIAGSSGSSSTLYDTFQKSDSLSTLPLYNGPVQQQFQGENDNQSNCYMGNELLTSVSYQADHYPPDLYVDQRVPPNCVQPSDPAEANQDDMKFIQHDAGNQKEELLQPSAHEPLFSGTISVPLSRNVCGEEYSSKQDVDKPMQIQTQEKRFKCHHCSYETSRRGDMRKHIMSEHSEEKSYKCKLCSFASAYQRSLRRHIQKKHPDGERPYQCILYDYATERKGTLATHMQSKHTGKRPYKCTICDFAAIEKFQLNVHIRRHTGDKPHMCDLCHYKTKTSSELKRHIMLKHHKQPLK